MEYTPEEARIKKDACDFIRKNKSLLFERFASVNVYTKDHNPVTVFMAGSPGAGKTEISEALISQFSHQAVRIDADEIRKMCSGYSGDNAHLFQLAASVGVEELYRHCIDNQFNLIMDGTFAHNKTFSNIENSLEKKRKVIIYFIYQEPLIAWKFTKKREVVTKRRITKETFIKGYCDSQKNVNEAKLKFSEKVELNLIIKNFENDAIASLHKNILSIDSYLDVIYDEAELNTMLI